MATVQQVTRLARLEADAGRREHVSVVMFRDRGDLPALLAGLPPGPFGVVVVPEPADPDAWSTATSGWRIHP